MRTEIPLTLTLPTGTATIRLYEDSETLLQGTLKQRGARTATLRLRNGAALTLNVYVRRSNSDSYVLFDSQQVGVFSNVNKNIFKWDLSGLQQIAIDVVNQSGSQNPWAPTLEIDSEPSDGSGC